MSFMFLIPIETMKPLLVGASSFLFIYAIHHLPPATLVLIVQILTIVLFL